MTEDVIAVGDTTFRAEVLEAEGPVLVDFTAAWCPPCRALEPVVDALATQHRGKLKVAKLDVDANHQTASQYGIRAMPTLLFFREGRVVQQIVGAVPRARLEAEVQKVLQQQSPGLPLKATAPAGG